MFGNKREEENRFIKKSDDNVGLVTLYTVVDVKTGVNYLITVGPNGVSTTPMYDQYGNFFVDEE